MSEAVVFAFLDHHPELVLRHVRADIRPPPNLDDEALRLVHLLDQNRRAVRRYAALANPDDGIPI